MPQNGLTVGKDFSLDVIFPIIGSIDFPVATSFDARPDTTDKKILPINGNPLHVVFQEGWTGSIVTERNNNEIEAAFARLEAAYFSGEDIPGGTIQTTVKEADGSLSKYLFTDVTFIFSDAGAYKGNDTVSMTINWRAGRKEAL